MFRVCVLPKDQVATQPRHGYGLDSCYYRFKAFIYYCFSNSGWKLRKFCLLLASSLFLGSFVHKVLSENDNLQHLENQTARVALGWYHGCRSLTPVSVLKECLRWFYDQWTVRTLWGWKRASWYVPILAWVLQLPGRKERKRNSFDSHLLKRMPRGTLTNNISWQHGFFRNSTAMVKGKVQLQVR